jgi:tetratricopeptide (TPR) repeat protein
MSPRARFFIVAAVGVPLVVAVLMLVHYMVSYSQGIDLYRRGMREMDANRYDAAISLFDAASHKKLDATNMSFVYGNRGWAYVRKHLDDQAIRDFSESIRLNAEPVYVFWDRGLAYHRKGEFEKALTDYSAALSRDPNLADVYHKRAQIFADRGDWGQAIADYGEAIRCEPGNDQFFVDRGMAFAANNELDSAIANFDAAIGFNRTHAGAYIQRAAAYGRKGNWMKGLADVTEAIQQLPDARQLRYARAYIYLDRGAVEEGISDCNESLRIMPDYEHGFLARARAEALMRDWDKVFRDTASALKLDPSLSLAHYLRGRAFTARGEFDQAISEFNETLRLEPSFQWAIVRRAMNYGYRRDYSRALQELRRALERFPRSEVPHLGLAWFLATCPEDTYRNGAEAIAEGLRGCEISYWEDWAAVDVLGAAYAENDDFDRAIKFASTALTLPGSSPKDRVLMQDRLSLYQARIAIRDMGSPGGSRNPVEEGMNAYARDDYDRALSYFNAVLPPNPAESFSPNLFQFLHGSQDTASGIPWALEGRALTNAFYYRGLTYERKHQWDKAIADFTTAILGEPESTLALSERAVSYSMKGETDRGLRDFDEAIRLKPNDANIYILRADMLRLAKRWDDALETATNAIQLDPSLSRAYYIRGLAYIGKKEHENAIREFSEADRRDPSHFQNILGRAHAFQRMGDYKSALADLREIVGRFPRSAYAHNALAWFLATCPDAAYRNGTEAVMYAQSACELGQSKDPAHLDTLAAAYAEVGDFDRAVKCVTQAISKMEPDAEYRTEVEEHLVLFQRKKACRAKPLE